MQFWNPPPRDALHHVLSSTSPSEWCQAFFILLSCGVLAVAVMPPSARRHLLDYGARSSTGKPEKEAQQDRFSNLVATLASWGQVPHSWFMGFYTTSLACSVFWLTQYLGHGRILHFLATKQAATSASTPSMLPGQVVIVWTMMFLQATRRIYEHSTFIKPSKSTMWCVHWLLGLSFYLCMSLSLWIEGSGRFLSDNVQSYSQLLTTCVESILDRRLTTFNAEACTPKTVGAVLVYLFAWASQYRCHKHLAGLKKYSLPEKGMFGYLISPHYTCECLLYMAMAVAGAPKGALYNKTLICGLVFIATNLGVTAAGTRKWYIEKFGAEPVRRKWNMIPLLF
jgi:3-oxo-5-alpha-steroid 4-dehydrogenase 3